MASSFPSCVSTANPAACCSTASCSTAFNCQRGTVVGPMVEGRYPVEVVVGGAKKRIRVRLENLRSINI